MRYTLEYKAAPFHNFMSRCGVELITRPDGRVVVVVSDLGGDDDGTSITNAAEQIAALIRQDHELIPEEMVYIEHYPDNNTWDRVRFTWTGNEYRSPVWEHITEDDFREIAKGGRV